MASLIQFPRGPFVQASGCKITAAPALRVYYVDTVGVPVTVIMRRMNERR